MKNLPYENQQEIPSDIYDILGAFEAPVIYSLSGSNTYNPAIRNNSINGIFNAVGGHLNFGYGYDLTVNGVNQANEAHFLESEGVASTVATAAAADAQLPSADITATLVLELNQAFSSSLQTQDPPSGTVSGANQDMTPSGSSIAQAVMEAASQTILLKSQESFDRQPNNDVEISGLPPGVQDAITLLTYNGGPIVGGPTNLIGPSATSDLELGNYGAFAYELAYNTSTPPGFPNADNFYGSAEYRDTMTAAIALGYTATVTATGHLLLSGEASPDLISDFLQAARDGASNNAASKYNETHGPGATLLALVARQAALQGPSFRLVQFADNGATDFSLLNNSTSIQISPTLHFIDGLDRAYTAPDPLVLDLGTNGIALSDLGSTDASFDFNGSGVAHQTGWIGSNSGLLVDDPTYASDGGGTDLTPSELSADLLGNSSESGFAALEALDSNGDGVINLSDNAFDDLYVWQDTNNNGVIDPGELESLSDLGISSINTNAASTNQTVNGNTVTEIGSYTTTNGTAHEIADVNFEQSATYTTFEQPVSIPPDIAALPNLHGFGTVNDLQSEMANDSTLANLVANFSELGTDTSFATVIGEVDAILEEWANTEGISPGSQGSYDDQKLTTLQAFAGEALSFQKDAVPAGDGAPAGAPSLMLPVVWTDFERAEAARLLLQGPLASLSGDFTYDADTDAVYITATIPDIAADIPQDVGNLSSNTFDEYESVSLIVDQAAIGSGIGNLEIADGLSDQGDGKLASLAFALSQDETVSLSADGTLIEGGSTIYGNSYYASLGCGYLELQPYSQIIYTSPTAPTLYLGDTITPSMVSAALDNQGRLVLLLGSDGDQVTLDPGSVSQVVFANGTTWSATQEEVGSLGATSLIGITSGMTFDPNGFANCITTVGDDNTVHFGTGDGVVALTMLDGSAAVLLGDGINASNLVFSVDQSNGDVTLSVSGTSDSLVMKGALEGEDASTITFSDGSVIFLSSLTLNADGTAASSSILSPGGSLNIVIPSGGISYAGPGSTTFTLSDGSKAIALQGSSTYIFATGTGSATIVPNTGGSLELTGNVSPADLSYGVDAEGNLVITNSSSGDVITLLSDFFTDTNGRIQSKVGSLSTPFGTQALGSNLFTSITSPLNGIEQGNDLLNNVFDITPTTTNVVAGSTENIYNYSGGDGDVYVTGTQEGDQLNFDSSASSGSLIFQSDSAGDLSISDGTPGDTIILMGDLSTASAGRTQSKVSDLTLSDGDNVALTTAASTWNVLSGTQLGSPYSFNSFNITPGSTSVTGCSMGNSFVVLGGSGRVSITPGSVTDTLMLATAKMTDQFIYQVDDATGTVVIKDTTIGTTVTIENDWQSRITGNIFSFSTGQDGGTIQLGSVIFSNYADTNGNVTASKYGTGNNLYLSSGAGTAYGTSGINNAYFDAPGQHTIDGGGGTGAYYYSAGDGSLVINPDVDGIIYFDDGTTVASDLTFQAVAATGSLVIEDGTNGDFITINNEFNPSNTEPVSEVFFSNGSSLRLNRITSTWNQDGGTAVGSNYTGNQFNLTPSPSGTTAEGGGGSMNSYNILTGQGLVTITPENSATITWEATTRRDAFTYSVDDSTGDLTIEDTTLGTTVVLKGDLSYQGSIVAVVSYLTLGDGSYLSLNSLTFGREADASGNVSGTALGYGTNLYLSPGSGTATGSANNHNNFYDAAGISASSPGDHAMIGGAYATNNYNYAVGDGLLTITPDSVYSNDALFIDDSSSRANGLSFSADLLTGTLSITDTTGNIDIKILDDLTITPGIYGSVTSQVGELQLSDGRSYNLASVPLTWIVGASASQVGVSNLSNIFDITPGTSTPTSVTGGSYGRPNAYNVVEGAGTVVIDPGQNDTLTLAAAAGTDTLSYSADAAGDLTITDTIIGTNVVINDDLSVAGRTISSMIPDLTLGDGTSIDLTRLTLKDIADGSGNVGANPLGNNNALYLTSGLTGTATGGATGVNTFYDAPGTHSIVGGAAPGSNVFNLDEGDGSLTITPGTSNDVLKLGAGITPDMVTLQASDATGNLTIDIADGAGTNDNIVVANDLSGAGNSLVSQLPLISFSSGETENLGGQHTFTWGDDGATAAVGSNMGINTFLLEGGLASITPGSYADNYESFAGAGFVTIAAGGAGTLDYAPGVTDQDIWLSQSGDDLIVQTLGTSDKMSFSNWFNSASDLARVSAGGLSLTNISSLEGTMANYQQQNPSFSPAGAMSMPTASSIQEAISAGWS